MLTGSCLRNLCPNIDIGSTAFHKDVTLQYPDNNTINMRVMGERRKGIHDARTDVAINSDVLSPVSYPIPIINFSASVL